jgi:hypothetical protein
LLPARDKGSPPSVSPGPKADACVISFSPLDGGKMSGLSKLNVSLELRRRCAFKAVDHRRRTNDAGYKTGLNDNQAKGLAVKG